MKLYFILFFGTLMMLIMGCVQQPKQADVDVSQSITEAGFSVYKKSVSRDKTIYQRPDLVLIGKFDYSGIHYDARFGLVVENANAILGEQNIYDCESLNIDKCNTYTTVKQNLDELINSNLATLIKSIVHSESDQLTPNAETITFDVFFYAQHIKKVASFNSSQGTNASIVYKEIEASDPMHIVTVQFPIKQLREDRIKWTELPKGRLIELLNNRTVLWNQYRIMNRAEYLRSKT